MTIALLFIGFGNVARRFVRLIDESRPAIAGLGVTPMTAGVVTGRHGSRFAASGLDALGLAADRDAGRPLGAGPSALEAILRMRDVRADIKIVVETTPLDVHAGEPAVSHLRAAFAAGLHGVTANKGPVALAYHALADEARRAGVSWLFEGAVMDGVPVFALIRETMPACDVRGFRGVVNSTTNYIISAMERGESFDAALRRMQELGVAEADPSLDVLGWDAAAKTAALANVWLDARITPADVTREGLSPETRERAQAARREGRFLKVVSSATRRDGAVHARVALAELTPDDPLAQLEGQANAIEIDTWPLGRVVVTQRDGGLEKTAYAILADLVTVVRRVQSGQPAGREDAR